MLGWTRRLNLRAARVPRQVLPQGAKTRVRVFADIQNFALRARHSLKGVQPRFPGSRQLTVGNLPQRQSGGRGCVRVHRLLHACLWGCSPPDAPGQGRVRDALAADSLPSQDLAVAERSILHSPRRTKPPSEHHLTLCTGHAVLKREWLVTERCRGVGGAKGACNPLW